MKKPQSLVLLVALLAMVAKIYCAWTTAGTMDVVCFREYGRMISDDGLIAMYRKTPMFNHTPLVGTFASVAYDLTEGNHQAFGLLLRLPGILADVIAVLALLWLRRKTGRPAWWALVLFAASPVAFMISGFHGNVDSIVAVVLLLTALACVAGEAALCGVLWGLACQVKVSPLLVAPVFFFFWWYRGQAMKFFVPAVLTALAGWAWPLAVIPETFLRHVLDYNSMWGTWGISAVLRLSGVAGMEGIKMSPSGAVVSEMLKFAMMAGVLTLSWRRRAVNPVALLTTLSLAWLIFFALAPGFCVQYLAWLAPFLLMHSGRWYAVLTAASSAALFAFYTVVCGKVPWNEAYNAVKTAPQWVPWLFLPWVAVLVCLAARWRDWRVVPTAPDHTSLPNTTDSDSTAVITPAV